MEITEKRIFILYSAWHALSLHDETSDMEEEARTPTIIVAGIGPGGADDMTRCVARAISDADVVVGYSGYMRYVEPLMRPDAERISTGMRHERERAIEALRHAAEGKRVVVVSGGDAGIYGMAPLVYQTLERLRSGRLTIDGVDADWGAVEIEVMPGISAFQKAASLVGSPISHDTCIISLSDLLTPWQEIERRIAAAAEGDFVTAVYNPRSHDRYWQLHRMREIFLSKGRRRSTPVAIVRQAGREGQATTLTTLGAMDPEAADMLSTVIIGNSHTYISMGKMITPRGYQAEAPAADNSATVGQAIMRESFLTIEGEMRHAAVPLGRKWALLHAIHTTADFDMEDILYVDEGAVEQLYAMAREGRLRTIVTDVTMVRSGIRKGALQRLGISAECFLDDPQTREMAERWGITRTQAGIRVAAERYPDALYAFGNAPTALMELCALIRQGRARPAGVIAAPVGFVHVREAKMMVKALSGFPKIIVEGRKGGSPLAATLCNAILTFDDAQALLPGRDL